MTEPAAPKPPSPPLERTREGTVKRPPNLMQEAAGGADAIIPDQTHGAGPERIDQSNETDAAQKSLRGSGPPSG